MKQPRSWISLLGFCLLSVLAAALVFAIIVAGASVALASHQNAAEESAQNAVPAAPLSPAPSSAKTFSGMITDSHCGARHMRTSRLNPAECARACFRKGASYILVDGDRRYTLVGGDESLSRLAGERANVLGTRQGDAILVDSATPLF